MGYGRVTDEFLDVNWKKENRNDEAAKESTEGRGSWAGIWCWRGRKESNIKIKTDRRT